VDITSWVIFAYFYIYLIRFKLKLVNAKKNPTNIEDFKHMGYICAKIILIIDFEKMVVGGIFG
jgi:hypothetical protein